MSVSKVQFKVSYKMFFCSSSEFHEVSSLAIILSHLVSLGYTGQSFV